MTVYRKSRSRLWRDPAYRPAKKPRIARPSLVTAGELSTQVTRTSRSGSGSPARSCGVRRSIRLDAEALEHVDQLARVLRRVPGRALEHDVHRLHAVVGLHLDRQRLVLRPDPTTSAAARSRLRRSGRSRRRSRKCRPSAARWRAGPRTPCRRSPTRGTPRRCGTHGGASRRIERSRFSITCSFDALGRHLAHVALQGAQHDYPLLDELGRAAAACARCPAGRRTRQRPRGSGRRRSSLPLATTGTLRTPSASSFSRPPASFTTSITTWSMPLFRKKLFRSKAAASPGLGEQNEFIGDDVHE